MDGLVKLGWLGKIDNLAWSMYTTGVNSNGPLPFSLIRIHMCRNPFRPACEPVESRCLLNSTPIRTTFSVQPLGDTQVALFWNPLPRAVEYLVQEAQVTTQAIKVHNRLVYRSQTGPWTTVATYNNSTLSTVLNGLKPSTNYQFNVITVGPHAQFPGIPQPVRTMDVLIPDPGSFTLKLSKVTTSQVSLSWTASKGANGYTVWGFTDAILNLLSTPTSTTTTITGLAAHTSYTFIVSAQSSAGGNVWSNNLVTTTTL